MRRNVRSKALLLHTYNEEIKRGVVLVGVKHGEIPARPRELPCAVGWGRVGVDIALEIKLSSPFRS